MSDTHITAAELELILRRCLLVGPSSPQDMRGLLTRCKATIEALEADCGELAAIESLVSDRGEVGCYAKVEALLSSSGRSEIDDLRAENAVLAAQVEDKRGLIRDLTTALENRNTERDTLTAKLREAREVLRELADQVDEFVEHGFVVDGEGDEPRLTGQARAVLAAQEPTPEESK